MKRRKILLIISSVFILTILILPVFQQKRPVMDREGRITDATPDYAPPVNTVPGIQEIEDSIRKSEEKRTKIADIESALKYEKQRHRDIPQTKKISESEPLPDRKSYITPPEEVLTSMESKEIAVY